MAFIDPISVELEGRVENPGESWQLSGRVDASSYAVGDKSFRLPDGISYDAVFTNAGDGILLSGMVRARVEGTCDRCLDPASFELASELQEYYLFREPEDPGEDEDFEVLGEDRVIDLSEPISDAIVMDTPFVVLCRPDCAGLCPTCGCNLNRETCDCAERAARERSESPENPFSVLKNLKLDDSDGGEAK